jgi:hypothetical protein
LRLGILIIGSLYWDPSPVRCRWRQNRLNCSDPHKVWVPIRYGKKAETRNYSYTMVFAESCSENAKLGIGIVVPARAECCEPEQLIEEAEHLWAAERNSDEKSGIGATWGKVCILKNPKAKVSASILKAWQSRIKTAGKGYATALPISKDEGPVLNARTGHALFAWPTDVMSKQPLAGFDLLLLTANEPTLIDSRRYPSAKEIAEAWKTKGNVNYFYNNRHYGITTFEDEQIVAALQGAA